ncbi:uncharacterized protein LOC111281528 [Durio zibethinus]|uniref:Uncharacterized protein LOC111281528 n=1 Tax=Durio zibethinus TaxID=66656 RepID=A0A6P5XBK8_DURZI|nr:uncharacterized protein LOC111281528 [Durio zibethinus]
MSIKHFTSFSLVLLATATFILSCQATARILDGGLCRKTDYPQLYRAVVKGTVHDPKLASGISIKSPELDDCLTSYDDAIDNLKKSLDNINQKNPSSLMSNLSAVVADYVTRDDEAGKAGSRLAATNEHFRHMASNCLALASQIKF